jgi:hypothetical protein
LNYDFGWYTYGPYLYDVTAAGYTVQSWQNMQALENMGMEIPKMPVSHEGLQRYKAFLNDCNNLPGHSRRYWLELLSSLHFIYNDAKPRADNKRDTFSNLEIIKPNKFPQDDKENAWELLNTYQLVDS